MSKRHFTSALYMLVASSCVLSIACSGPVANDGAESAEEANHERVTVIPSNDAGVGAWRLFGGEFCGDYCGTLDCLCIPNSCPPRPEGKPCSPIGVECFEKFRGSDVATSYICQ